MICNQVESGCKIIVALDELDAHLKKCDYGPNKMVKCKDCEANVIRKDLKSHQCLVDLRNAINLGKKELTKQAGQIKKLQETVKRQDKIIKEAMSVIDEQKRMQLHPRLNAIEPFALSYETISSSLASRHEAARDASASSAVSDDESESCSDNQCENQSFDCERDESKPTPLKSNGQDIPDEVFMSRNPPPKQRRGIFGSILNLFWPNTKEQLPHGKRPIHDFKDTEMQKRVKQDVDQSNL